MNVYKLTDQKFRRLFALSFSWSVNIMHQVLLSVNTMKKNSAFKQYDKKYREKQLINGI